MLAYKVPYTLPAKNYSYLIQAYEIKPDITEETKKDEEDEIPYLGVPFFFTAQKTSISPTVTKTESKIGKEFLIFYTPEFEITVTIDSMEITSNNYKVYIEKKNKTTNIIDSFFCFIPCDLLIKLFI